MKNRPENRKNVLIKEALAEFPLTVALYFQTENGAGLLLGSRGNRKDPPWFEINIPKSLVNSKFGEKDDFKKKFPAGVVVGIGPRPELTSIVDIYRDIITDELTNVGLYEDFPKYAIECLAEEINLTYRAMDPAIPFRVELLVMSYINDVLDLARIKADGDFHNLNGYGVIVGYQEMESGKSIRGMALELLRAAYEKGYPSPEQAKKLMKLLLDLDKTSYLRNFSATITLY